MGNIFLSFGMLDFSAQKKKVLFFEIETCFELMFCENDFVKQLFCPDAGNNAIMGDSSSLKQILAC